MSKDALVRKLCIQHGATDCRPSHRQYKKYMVIYKGREIHFGDNRYEDYLDHKDKARRDNYRARASKIRNGTGELTVKNKFSPNYWAYNILW
jgi:hypothetical protein